MLLCSGMCPTLSGGKNSSYTKKKLEKKNLRACPQHRTAESQLSRPLPLPVLVQQEKKTNKNKK